MRNPKEGTGLLCKGHTACKREGSTPSEESRENKGSRKILSLAESDFCVGSAGKCSWLVIMFTGELGSWASLLWGHSALCRHLLSHSNHILLLVPFHYSRHCPILPSHFYTAKLPYLRKAVPITLLPNICAHSLRVLSIVPTLGRCRCYACLLVDKMIAHSDFFCRF